ncbi:MAG: zf-TFIIB domain-containing protein [Bacteroidota bacterium]|nr:zf-TFIIB domain-containing protein [Bacteroidota bacterium]
MKCPACGSELRSEKTGETMLDVCDSCGGVWFDEFEFKRFDNSSQPINQDILDLRKKENISVNAEENRICPKCENMPMLTHFESPERKVKVNECPMCGGIWLDAGELAAIRGEFKTEEERNKAVEEFINKEIGPQLKAEKEKELEE